MGSTNPTSEGGFPRLGSPMPPRAQTSMKKRRSKTSDIPYPLNSSGIAYSLDQKLLVGKFTPHKTFDGENSPIRLHSPVSPFAKFFNINAPINKPVHKKISYYNTEMQAN